MCTCARAGVSTPRHTTPHHPTPPQRHNTYTKTHQNNDTHGIDTYIAYTLYTRKVLVQARRIWSRFDVSLILMGVIVLTLTVLCLVTSTSQGPNLLSKHGPISLIVGLFASLASVVRPLQSLLSASEDSVMTMSHEAVFLFLTGSLTMLLIRGVISGVSRIDTTAVVARTRWSWSWNWGLGLVLALMYVSAPGSDSFTIWEDHLTVYLLQTFGFYNLALALSVKESESRWKIVQLS